MNILLANAGVPMIGVEMDMMIRALVPIIVLEAIVYRVRLRQPILQSLGVSLQANALSTFVGVPMTWVALWFAEIWFVPMDDSWGLETPLGRIAAVTLQAPHLLPYGDNAMRWMIPAASLFLLFPFLVVSAIVESWAIGRLWPELPKARIRSTSWIANGISYAFLMAYAGYGLYRAVRMRE